MKIDTVVQDIYKLFGGANGWFSNELATELSQDISLRLRSQLGRNRSLEKPRLRLSEMGPRCPKALWHSQHTPELREALPPWAEIKFTYGHVLEALVLTYARAAGHHVTGEQDEVILDGIVGHRDAVIDGCVVDVKSASSRAFDKFKTGRIAQEDSFGYLEQLDGYVTASFEDPLVTVKDRGYLLAIDKTLGHLCLYEHTVRPNHIRERIRKHKEIVARTSSPSCECGTRLSGKSGNIELDTVASYNGFKHSCFPGLRTFLYASGPVYLTKVARLPAEHITEIDKHGNYIYH